jgi:hypothetical protein
MGKLSLFSYVWKCVAGAEVVYLLCLMGAFVLERTAKGAELHHTLFETLPGFLLADASERDTRRCVYFRLRRHLRHLHGMDA